MVKSGIKITPSNGQRPVTVRYGEHGLTKENEAEWIKNMQGGNNE